MREESPIHKELRLLADALDLLMETQQLAESERALFTEQIRNLLLTGQRCCKQQPFAVRSVSQHGSYLIIGDDVPPSPGFSLRQRLAYLGYRLPEEGLVSLHSLSALICESYHARFEGRPMHYQGSNWYEEIDAEWIDQIIREYMEYNCDDEMKGES